MASGLSKTEYNSLRILECSLSGPGDLFGFKFFNFFWTSSLFILQ